MRVLAIDGGGIRGIIPALVLAELEDRTGHRAADLFDLVAGTSTGGILAAALTRPGGEGGPGQDAHPRYSARDLLGLYEAEGPEIFDRSLLKRIRSVDGWLDERYDDAGLEAALRRYLDGTRLSDALTDVLITAYEIERREAFFFRSARARADPTYDFTLADACRATAAAPTYFEPARVGDLAGDATYALVDGGVFATNPVLCAVADVARAGRLDEVELVAVAGHGLAHAAAALRARPQLGRARVGALDRRRRLRRGRRHDGLRGGPDPGAGPLRAAPDRPAGRQRRPRRRLAAEHGRPPGGGRAPPARQRGRRRRAGRAALAAGRAAAGGAAAAGRRHADLNGRRADLNGRARRLRPPAPRRRFATSSLGPWGPSPFPWGVA